MNYLHTMVRVTDLTASLDFYCNKLGLVEASRIENEAGRFTLVFLVAPNDLSGSSAQHSLASNNSDQTPASIAIQQGVPALELTFNWDVQAVTGGRNFGHLAYSVSDIYSLCQTLLDSGVAINRPPRDGHMAFIRSPDGISIELLQAGEALPIQEPWASMANVGEW